MSYTFALSSPDTPCSLRSGSSSRSNSISSTYSTSSTSSSIYLRSSFSTLAAPTPKRKAAPEPQPAKFSLSLRKNQATFTKAQLVDVKEAGEAREAHFRAIRLRESLLKDVSSNPDEDGSGDEWKSHYERMGKK